MSPKLGIAASAEPVIKNFLRVMLLVVICASLVVYLLFYIVQVPKEKTTKGGFCIAGGSGEIGFAETAFRVDHRHQIPLEQLAVNRKD
jgi:hypothetical protein